MPFSSGDIGIGAPVDEQADHRGAVRFGSVEERRRSVDGADVDGSAPIDEQRRDRDLARLRRSAKRGRALPVFRVDRRAAIEEGARFGLAAEPRDGEQ